MEIINAVKENARDLAYLINLAGEGIPEYLWTGMIEGDESPLDVGERRASREEGGFSYTNAKVCMSDNALTGMIISYRQPSPYNIDDISEYPEVVCPLVVLESRAPGSWYINAIATSEAHRGRGVASRLIADAEKNAIEASCSVMSLIVASENTKAVRLYEYLDFETVDSLPVVPYPGCLHGGDWILMTRQIVVG